MGIMRAIIKWCDKKYDEAIEEENDFKAGTKAFGSGFVEGFFDGAIIMYFVTLITCIVAGVKSNKDE
jgi:hypothetical protein